MSELIDKTFFITGQPIILNKYGALNFVKVGQYYKFVQYVELLNMSSSEMRDILAKIYGQKIGDYRLAKQVFKAFDKLTRFQLIKEFENNPIYMAFNDVFDMLMDNKGVLALVNEDEFELIVKLIMEMNGVKPKKKFENEELRYFAELQDELDNRRSKLDWESIYTCVWQSLKHDPKDLTLYQFYSLFFRYSKTMQYFATTIYSTVTQVDLVNFCDPVDVFGKEEKKETLQEFERRASKLN